MFIVYLIKIKKEQYPNKYIGSKTNCIVENNKILSKNKEYFGSSKDKNYVNMLKKYGYDVIVLGEYNNYEDMILAEKEFHIKYDVVANAEFFNKSIATTSSYSNPNYATYKNILTGKIARLEKNHPKVLLGEWVGVTYGNILSEEEKKKRSKPSPMKGKKISMDIPKYKESNEKMKKTKLEKQMRWYTNGIDNMMISKNQEIPPDFVLGRKACQHSNERKSEEHRRKISESNKNQITLKNKFTNECVRLPREKTTHLDRNIWQNPFKLAMERKKEKDESKIN